MGTGAQTVRLKTNKVSKSQSFRSESARWQQVAAQNTAIGVIEHPVWYKNIDKEIVWQYIYIAAIHSARLHPHHQKDIITSVQST
jgi:hypothetical protein